MPDELAGTEQEQQPSAEVSKRRTQPSSQPQDFRRCARGGKAYRFYKSVSWGQWWSEFLDVTQDGKLRYPTVWSLAKAKGRTDWERKLIFEIVGPQPKLAPGKKLRVPWLGDWEGRRAQRVLDQADPATRRKIRRALKERAECMDQVRRTAALMTIQEIGRWERASEQVDLSFGGQPFLPNEAPDSPRNRVRSHAFIEMHKQVSENMLRAVVRFIALSRSEPADESGWMRIAEAFEKK